MAAEAHRARLHVSAEQGGEPRVLRRPLVHGPHVGGVIQAWSVHGRGLRVDAPLDSPGHALVPADEGGRVLTPTLHPRRHDLQLHAAFGGLRAAPRRAVSQW